jgi:hypothetical protein
MTSFRHTPRFHAAAIFAIFVFIIFIDFESPPLDYFSLTTAFFEPLMMMTFLPPSYFLFVSSSRFLLQPLSCARFHSRQLIRQMPASCLSVGRGRFQLIFGCISDGEPTGQSR